MIGFLGWARPWWARLLLRAENAALAWCHFAAGVGIHHAQRELFGGWCCAAQRPILLLAACPLVGGRLLTVVGRIAQ